VSGGPAGENTRPPYEDWLGRQVEEVDRLDLFPARGMAALLDRDPQALVEGNDLPRGWHWLYFKPIAPQKGLGPDGHPARGDFLPPIELPRRMWAGGRLHFRAPLPLGAQARRRSEVLSVAVKEGRSGTLGFVTVGHRVTGPDGVRPSTATASTTTTPTPPAWKDTPASWCTPR
jgi:3-methylfumaryl-CoA hydratase